jgi:molybdate transport system substrate-binding protein
MSATASRTHPHHEEEDKMHPSRLVVTALAAVVALSGCAKKNLSPGTAASASPSATAPSVAGGGTVFAAASLTESFKQIGDEFHKAHPDATVTFNFGSSGTLATQIVEGGGVADVFASADDANMKKVSDASLVDGSPKTFARNRLEIVVAKRNPKRINGLADLAKPGLKVVLAAATVPVGRYGTQALEKAKVTVKPVSQEADVKAVLQKVALGEADAGIVYQTDVKAAADKVDGVDIPDSENVVAAYPIAVIRNTKNPELAKAFVELVVSDDGQKILVEHGFLAP